MASVSPELQVGVRPQRGQEEQVDQHEQQGTLRVVVLVHDPLPRPTRPGAAALGPYDPGHTPSPGRGRYARPEEDAPRMISADTTLARLLDEHPELVEGLARYHAHIPQLRNPEGLAPTPPG